MKVGLLIRMLCSVFHVVVPKGIILRKHPETCLRGYKNVKQMSGYTELSAIDQHIDKRTHLPKWDEVSVINE